MTLPSSPTSGGPRPWEKRPLNKAVQLSLVALTVVMASAAIIATILVVVLSLNPQSTGGISLGGASIATMVVLVCGAGLFWSVPLLRRSVSFKPSYTPPPPTARGQLFEVMYSSAGLTSRSLSGQGELRFDDEGLTVQGTLRPHIALQLVSFAALAGILLLVFRASTAVILPLMLIPLLGQKTTSRTISYIDIRELELKGSQVRFHCNGQPGQVAFLVASVDGERLYRELLARFPGALGGWTI